MSIKIETNKCVGCGKCLLVCPGSLLYQDGKKKAYNKYPKDCWGCTACLKECPHAAIKYYLGADIGGQGSMVYTKREKHLLHWHIVSPDGKEQIVTINQKESNQY